MSFVSIPDNDWGFILCLRVFFMILKLFLKYIFSWKCMWLLLVTYSQSITERINIFQLNVHAAQPWDCGFLGPVRNSVIPKPRHLVPNESSGGGTDRQPATDRQTDRQEDRQTDRRHRSLSVVVFRLAAARLHHASLEVVVIGLWWRPTSG